MADHKANSESRNGKKNGEDLDLFCRIRDAFGVFARKTSNILGSAWAFVVAILIIVVWAATGPTFGY